MRGKTLVKTAEEGIKEAYFFDTYAFLEILDGNKDYEKYRNSIKITTIFNLMELHLSLLRGAGNAYAKGVYHKLMRHVVPVYDKAIFDGNRLKLIMKGASYVDCVGYAMARHHGIKFLTGDRLFKNMEGVEFVE